MPQVYRNTTFKLIQGTQTLKILINYLDRHGDSRKTINVDSKPNPLEVLSRYDGAELSLRRPSGTTN
jgi:hypothetical protein